MLTIYPLKKDFTEGARSGSLSPVYAELPFVPPQQLYQNLEGPYTALLESIKGPEKIARYSFIGVRPCLVFKVKKGEVEEVSKGKRLLSSAHPLRRLRTVMYRYKITAPECLPPFVGGAVGMLGYDFVHYLERLPCTAVDDIHIPDAHFMIFDTTIAFDHARRKTWIISCPGAEEAVNETTLHIDQWGTYYDRACEKIHGLYETVARTKPPVGRAPGRRGIRIGHEMGKIHYMDIVRRAKEYIKAGDIFQANLSQRVSAGIKDIHPWELYKTLSRINPSPFAAYLNMDSYCIASSSPERLVRVSGSSVDTRPIAGTRPRGKNEESDVLMRTELLLNEKERAEHLMLIDLERNDLGKISDYSTVEVDELMITEDYSHVIHIVSNIKGIMAKGRDCFDAIKATFPGGTITGVPKVRCMEIIDELEPVVRGPYTGSIGYISFTGDMDLNIVIRTFVITNNVAYVQAGAGIVADSDPEKEYYETLKKAEALIKTLEDI